MEIGALAAARECRAQLELPCLECWAGLSAEMRILLSDA